MATLGLQSFVSEMQSAKFGITDKWRSEVTHADTEMLEKIGMSQIQAQTFTAAARKLTA